MKRFILWFLLILVLAGGGYWAYVSFVKRDFNLNALTVIPADAIYIIETNQPLKSWNQISQSDVWTHLKTNKLFAEIGASANALDSVIKENDELLNLLGDRQVYISAHKIKYNDYDFLYVIDLEKGARLDFLQTALKTAFEVGGFRISDYQYNKREIVKCFDRSTGESLQFTIIDNQLVCSYTAKLVEASIDASENPHFPLDEKFKQIADRTPNGGLFKIYICGAYFDDFMMCYQQPLDATTIDISNFMKFAGMKTNIDGDGISMEGFANMDDSIPSYLKAMLENGNGTNSAPEILSEKTALYINLGFEKFSEFFNSFENLMQQDSAKWETYKKNYRQIEKFLNINIKENFVSWVGSEVGYVMMPPTDSLKVKDYALIIKANSIDKAKENMKSIAKKIKRRTFILKVKKEEYNGYEINTIAIKGFFKLMFGKMFDKFEKPYYTYIDDYAIFSNNSSTLHTMIDDYIAGKTLAKYEAYDKLYNNFNKKSNLFVYINMPQFLPLSRENVSASTFKSMQANEKYITCFKHTGFQLTGYEQFFNVKLNSEFYKAPELPTDSIAASIIDSVLADSVNSMIGAESKASWELNFTDEPIIENHTLKQYVEHGTILIYEVALDEEDHKSGFYTEFDRNKKVRIKGKFKDDKPSGKWTWFDENGKIIERKEYSQ
jgi:hypothetical protein